MPYPRKTHTICMLPNIFRRAKKLSENQFLAEHTLAKIIEPTAGTSRLEELLVWSEEGIFCALARSCWRVTFQKDLENFPSGVCPRFHTSPESRKGQGRPPFRFTSTIFSSSTKTLGSTWVVVRSKPSARALGPKWMQSAKVTSSLCFSNFCRFSFCLSWMGFYHIFYPALYQCSLGREDILG